jgi:hypothetical protein
VRNVVVVEEAVEKKILLDVLPVFVSWNAVRIDLFEMVTMM